MEMYTQAINTIWGAAKYLVQRILVENFKLLLLL